MNNQIAYLTGNAFIGVTEVKADPVVQSAMKALMQEHDLLKLAGLSDNLTAWIMMKDWGESGGFTNNGYKLHNNPGNIMWNSHDKHGTKGTWNAANKTFYSHYASLSDYVAKLIEVLSQSPGRPIDAKDAHDFVHRLKLNNYFGKKSEEEYFNMMKGAGKIIDTMSSIQDNSFQTVAPEQKNAFQNFLDNFKNIFATMSTVAKVGVGAAAFLLLLALTKRR